MASGSKYETMAKTVDKKVEILKESVSDVVKQKQLEAELTRLDEEYQQRIDEVKNTPINTELQIQQAKAALQSAKKESARQKCMAIERAEFAIREAELELQSRKNELNQIKEIAAEKEEYINLQATQDYERLVSAAGNVEQSLALRVNKIKQEQATRKRTIEISLSNIKITNEAQAEIKQCIDKLYNDLKEISLKLGDSAK